MSFGAGAYGAGTGPFTTAVELAPEHQRVRIFKREGKLDEGYREGDAWFVYEGGQRAWRIAPGAVLAWAPLQGGA